MRLRKKYGALGPSWIGTQRRVAPRDVLIFGGGTWPPPGAVAMQKAYDMRRGDLSVILDP